jgi:hypothetical protein
MAKHHQKSYFVSLHLYYSNELRKMEELMGKNPTFDGREVVVLDIIRQHNDRSYFEIIDKEDYNQNNED